MLLCSTVVVNKDEYIVGIR